jgi:2-methylisocitrate lyase-like PEP mutase family enzyme
MNKTQAFRALHHGSRPFFLGNVWNPLSAQILEKSGFNALGTSSAAVAHSMGYEDGENIPFDEYLYIIKRIASTTSLPLSVDLEAGYGSNAESICVNIIALHQLGVVGINWEDSIISPEGRKLTDAEKSKELLRDICLYIKDAQLDMFINVRCDAFLVCKSDALKEAKHRMNLYESTGIDGIFFPGLIKENDICEITRNTALPINLMCMPGLPNFETLTHSGVKRISMGNYLHNFVYTQMEKSAREILFSTNFTRLYENEIN